MSWLLNSLANSLNLDDDGDHNDDDNKDTGKNSTSSTTTAAAAVTTAGGGTENLNSPQENVDRPINSDPTTPHRGVKDDLSEISKTFTRQLWGVAAFLAPPPPPPEISSSSGDAAEEDPVRVAGIRSDLSEIGGKFRSEISKLSSNKAVTEFTKIASNLLQFGVDDDFSAKDYADRGVVGVTDEVVDFARDVALHPETWLDFPLPHDDDDDDDDEDFDLSDAQQEHALALERLVPELAALRTELCLGYMTEGSFWKIYFVLVHPRLSKDDAVILSTPPIMKARAMLTQELQSRGRSRKHGSGTADIAVDRSETSHEAQLSVPAVDKSEYIPVEIISPAQAPSEKTRDVEADKHPVTIPEVVVIEKEAVEEVPVKPTVSEKSTATTSKSIVSEEKDDDDADEWLKEETETSSFAGTSYPVGNEDDEDVSFSDLEEEDDVPASYKMVGESSTTTKKSSTYPSGSNEVSSSTAKNKESNDWLDIEDIDDA